jgi:hypothetical protein
LWVSFSGPFNASERGSEKQRSFPLEIGIGQCGETETARCYSASVAIVPRRCERGFPGQLVPESIDVATAIPGAWARLPSVSRSPPGDRAGGKTPFAMIKGHTPRRLPLSFRSSGGVRGIAPLHAQPHPTRPPMVGDAGRRPSDPRDTASFFQQCGARVASPGSRPSGRALSHRRR